MGILELVKQYKIAEAKQEGMEKGIEKGMEKGMEKGIEKGMEKGMEKSAVHLLENGFTAEEVSNLIKLELKTVQKLAAEMKGGKPKRDD